MQLFNLIIILFAITNYHVFGKRIQRRTKVERGEIVFANKSFCSECFMKVSKINKKTMGVNLTLDLIKDVPNNAKLSFMVNKFDGGVYKKTAIQFVQPICQLLEVTYPHVFGTYIKNGLLKNFIKPKCPLQKGRYYVLNADVQDPNFEYLPLWRAQIDIQVFTPEYKLLQAYTYIQIVDDYV